MTDQYDVNLYNDQELVSILGLVNPSDRELEAKIVDLIRRYSFIRTTSGQQLYKFFVDIYDHFFDNSESQNELEEFQTMETASNQAQSQPPQPQQPQNPKAEKADQTVSLIQQLDYTAGKLNPILKETYRRTISIDSQYRDAEYKMSTDFTLNFTETLKDVVSIKLFAVQLPITWYTINENYGSNFFYLKSDTPGIDNENHEYRLDVPAGNYVPQTLQTEIYNSFTNLRNAYTDVNFGNTTINYNTTDCKSTITIDIQKVYNEHNYELQFQKTATEAGSIAKFLGFQKSSYDLYTVYTPTMSSVNNNTTYKIDTNNRSFKIIQYNSQLYTNPLFTSKTYDSIILDYESYQNITSESQQILIDVSYSQAEVITVTLPTLRPTISLTGLVEDVNTAIENNPKLDSVSGVVRDLSNDRFMWNIKLNRYTTKNIPNSKTVLVFPYDSTWSDISNSRQLWVDGSSAFGFTKTPLSSNNSEAIIETSNIYSDVEKTTSFTTSNNKLFLICNDPKINPNTSTNTFNANFDFSFNIQDSSTYLQSSLVTEMNRSIKAHPDYSNNLLGTQFELDYNNSEMKSIIQISKKFNASYFYDYTTPIALIGKSILQNVLYGDYIYNVIENVHTYEKRIPTASNYSYINSNNDNEDTIETLFTIAPIQNSIFKDVSFNVLDTSYNFYMNNSNKNISVTQLVKNVNNILKTYQFDPSSNNYPFKESSFSITPTGFNNESLVSLKLIINFEITEANYRLDFYPYSYPNTWNNAFLLDSSYNLKNYIIDSSYAEIKGGVVEFDEQIITDSIILKPKYSSVGGVYIASSTANDITIPISTNGITVTRETLVEQINTALKTNELTKGSYLEVIQSNIANATIRIKIRWNINKIYTTKDYRLVFFDIYSFVKCNQSTKSFKNATIDNTLGWILGFRNLSEYPLTSENKYSDDTFRNPYTLLSTYSKYSYHEVFMNDTTQNPSNVIITLTGDTTVSVNLYNYFMIILDDFNQNHLNDGLVTVTKRDNSVTLPSYASRKKYTCDPVTGEIVNTGIPTGLNNLTQNQLYSLNQIINTQNRNRGEVNSGPFIKDMFALIPVKTAGMTPGSIFVEYGGTLQNQERMYFGPVNISRMHIKLINDRGDVVDLNGANWSLQLICEQLYQKQKTTT